MGRCDLNTPLLHSQNGEQSPGKQNSPSEHQCILNGSRIGLRSGIQLLREHVLMEGKTFSTWGAAGTTKPSTENTSGKQRVSFQGVSGTCGTY